MEEWPDAPLLPVQLKERWDGIERTFEAELKSRLFVLVLPHRVPYWTSQAQEMCGHEVLPLLELLAQSFPSATYDAAEAGNCFACERFTACVYHQMRAAEFGLIAVADAIRVPEGKKTSWDRLIQGIQSELKRLESAPTKPDDWPQQRKKYGDLCSWFTTIKNGWRNPVSHTPRAYAEPTARGLFSALHTLFEHLQSYGIKQVTMPMDAMILPDSTGGGVA